MPASLWLALALAATPADSVARPAPLVTPIRAALATPVAGDTTPRPRAITVSDAYATRLRIHRVASYTILPLFAAQYVLGNRLLDQKEAVQEGRRNESVDAGLRRNHAIVAGTVGAVFALNTVTGVWNLIEGRQATEGRTRRTLHAIGMLAADAGFVATGLLGSRTTDRGVDEARRHRNVALGSVAVATASTVGMWLFNRD